MRIGFAFDLSRIWEHSVKDKRFGIVSAYKKGLPEAENEKRAESMKDYVRKLGYGYKEIYGVWESWDGTITIEYPLFIPNLYRHGAIFLGRDEYLMEGRCSPQEAVFVGDGSEILLINAAEDTVKRRWSQTEAGWMEMWEGWSELKGKEWGCGSVHGVCRKCLKLNPGRVRSRVALIKAIQAPLHLVGSKLKNCI